MLRALYAAPKRIQQPVPAVGLVKTATPDVSIYMYVGINPSE
jgi:hypothetical protein